MNYPAASCEVSVWKERHVLSAASSEVCTCFGINRNIRAGKNKQGYALDSPPAANQPPSTTKICPVM